MEWVETTAKTLEAAQDKALDQLGVARDEAEFEILEEPRSGLFGLMRGEARVRARVKPASVRPKQDRRRNRRGEGKGRGRDSSRKDGSRSNENERGKGRKNNEKSNKGSASSDKKRNDDQDKDRRGSSDTKEAMMNSSESTPDVSVPPADVAAAAEKFLSGLVDSFGMSGTVSSEVDGQEIEVAVSGDELGLLIGPSGRTLSAIQDLTRVSAQRRLGDHETRLRVDVAGYREKRQAALEQFTRRVAADVIESGEARALEPMASADRKVVHDTINDIDGVESRSDGADPGRRVVVVPAE